MAKPIVEKSASLRFRDGVSDKFYDIVARMLSDPGKQEGFDVEQYLTSSARPAYPWSLTTKYGRSLKTSTAICKIAAGGEQEVLTAMDKLLREKTAKGYSVSGMPFDSSGVLCLEKNAEEVDLPSWIERTQVAESALMSPVVEWALLGARPAQVQLRWSPEVGATKGWHQLGLPPQGRATSWFLRILKELRDRSAGFSRPVRLELAVPADEQQGEVVYVTDVSYGDVDSLMTRQEFLREQVLPVLRSTGIAFEMPESVWTAEDKERILFELGASSPIKVIAKNRIHLGHTAGVLMNRTDLLACVS